MGQLVHCLQAQGQAPEQTLVVGDRAMLSAEIAMAYKKVGLRFLGGLRGRKELLRVWTDEQFEDYPIVTGPNPQYWGRGCQVTFSHEGRTVTNKGLVVLAGPLRDQWRQKRRQRLQALGRRNWHRCGLTSANLVYAASRQYNAEPTRNYETQTWENSCKSAPMKLLPAL
ncbi:MAG: hypothetical protein GY759_23330 [Chloroflexi bacterium]|nr:hypothetical protein [Chloroflexota bacterium]